MRISDWSSDVCSSDLDGSLSTDSISMAWPPMFRLIAWAWAWETVAACAGEMESITSAVAAEAAPSRTAVLFTGITYSNGFAGMTDQRHTRKQVTRILQN